MPISATGNRLPGPPGGAATGFTLIELMVVLAIIGLVSATVVLTLPDAPAGPGEEARRLATRLMAARQESITSGELIGVHLDRDGYAFLRYRRGRWQPVGEDGILERRPWAEETVVTLERDGGGPVSPGASEDAEEAVPVPDLRFEPVGFATPFTLALERDRRRYVIVGDATGTIAVGPADDMH